MPAKKSATLNVGFPGAGGRTISATSSFAGPRGAGPACAAAWDESGAHSADYDVIMTSKVIGKCKEQLEGFGIVLEDTIDVILDVETTGFVKKSKAAPIKAKSKIKAGIWNRFQAFLTNWVG